MPLATIGKLIELLPEPTKTVVALIVFGSLRIGEVLALRWRHIEADRINIEERTRRLEDMGLSPVAVLRRAGLPMGLFNQEKILLTTEEFFAFYRGIAEVSRDPAIGLKLGTGDRSRRGHPSRGSDFRCRSERRERSQKRISLILSTTNGCPFECPSRKAKLQVEKIGRP